MAFLSGAGQQMLTPSRFKLTAEIVNVAENGYNVHAELLTE
jgi:hypothetical protein